MQLVRAGRFDDVIPIESVRSVLDIIPDLPKELVSEVTLWPIAFLDELRVCLSVMGPDALQEEVAILRERVRIQKEKSDKKEKDDN